MKPGYVAVQEEAGTPNAPGVLAPSDKIRKWTSFLLLGSGILLLGFHFLVIALSLSPDNPLKHQYKIQISRYVEPFFSQSWNLFSPNPINSNMTVLLKFKIFERGRVDTTQWVDIMAPLIDHRKTHFWSPAQRVTKYLTSCMHSILENRKITLDFIAKDDSLSKDSLAAAKFYSRLSKEWFGHQAIIQYANYVFQKMSGEWRLQGMDSVFVTYKIFDAKFPRFSKRKQDYFDLKNYQFAEYQSEFEPLFNRAEIEPR